MRMAAWQAMKLDEFKKMIREEFGTEMEHATPANVRDFVDRIENEAICANPGQRIILEESKTTYEEVVKDYFARVLEMPTEDALVSLWTLALDLTFEGIESQYSERLTPLFGDLE